MEYKSTILIADDEASSRMTLEALLYNEGYILEFAENGQEALERAIEIKPDLILLDVMMPMMNGFDVCKALRKDTVLSDVPIIMITALDDKDSRLQGIEAGADDFITKPFDKNELRTRVKAIVRLNRYRHLLVERSKFHWVIQNAEDGYVLLNKDKEIVFANSKARHFLNLSLDESNEIQETFFSLVNQQYNCQPRENWENWVDKNDYENQKLFLVRPETQVAREFWIQVEVFNLPFGEDDGWVIRLRDITENVELQRELSKFHGLIAHKLNTPLAGIIGSLELLSKQSLKMSAEKIKDFTDIALRSAKKLDLSVKAIFNYLNTQSKLTNGEKLEIEKISGLINTIAKELEIKNFKIVNNALFENEYIGFPKNTFEMVLWNIMENSKKFHPQQDPEVEIMLSKTIKNELKIQICDNGVSLSPDQLVQMWMPYYQGEKYFTGQTKGMGLGLALVTTLLWQKKAMCRSYNRKNGPGIIVELLIPIEA